jgi:vancomycin resistance protein VanJ
MAARSGVLLAAALYPAALLALTVIHVISPQRSGPLALSQIVAPHLFAAALLLVPLALVRGERLLRLLLLTALLVAVARFGDEFVSFGGPTPASGDTLSALTWNLEAGSVRGEQLLEVLGGTEASVVALQELTPEHASLLEADARVSARFPHRLLTPRAGVLGIGLLSAYPIRQAEVRSTPGQLVTLDVHGQQLTVLNAHPLPGTIRTVTPLRIPFDFDPSQRDADIAALRTWIQPALSRQNAVLVLGDYNVTEREPAYQTLANGLRDAHLIVGNGSGASWRPERFKELPVGLLRIDYLFSAGGLNPIAVTTDCTPRGGDHCLVMASFAFGGVETPRQSVTSS